ncbi:hypothetical protein AB5I41_30895 [Sphingomonas sp. MMS24-JH45]
MPSDVDRDPHLRARGVTNYAELVVEIRDLMDDADYSQQAIDRALRKASRV